MARPLETVVHIAHHQFFVQDAEARWDGQFRNNPWAQEGPGVADGLLGVLSPRAAGPAPVFLEIHRKEPVLPNDRFCKITEADLEILSGTLQIFGEENTESLPGLDFRVTPGTYTVRILYADLNTVTYGGCDGAEHYFLQMYPLELSAIFAEETEGASGEYAIGSNAIMGNSQRNFSSRILRPYEDLDYPIREPVDARSVPELHWQAQNGSPSERCSAAVALGRKKQLKAVQQMALSDSSRAVRLVAVGALALMEAREYLEMVADRQSGFLERTARMYLTELS